MSKHIPLFDALYREFNLNNDSALARLTKTHFSSISRIRSGKMPICDAMIARTPRATGWSVRRIDDLLPREVA